MSRPNEPGASKDKMKPLPEEYVSPISGQTIRPLDKAEPHEPVRDIRPQAVFEATEADVAEFLHMRAMTRAEGKPLVPLGDVIPPGQTLGQYVAGLNYLEIAFPSANGKPVHTEDSRGFMKNSKKYFH